MNNSWKLSGLQTNTLILFVCWILDTRCTTPLLCISSLWLDKETPRIMRAVSKVVQGPSRPRHWQELHRILECSVVLLHLPQSPRTSLSVVMISWIVVSGKYWSPRWSVQKLVRWMNKQAQTRHQTFSPLPSSPSLPIPPWLLKLVITLSNRLFILHSRCRTSLYSQRDLFRSNNQWLP